MYVPLTVSRLNKSKIPFLLADTIDFSLANHSFLCSLSYIYI